MSQHRFRVMDTASNETVKLFSTRTLEFAERHAAVLSANTGREYAARRLVESCTLDSCDCSQSYDVCAVLTI